MGLLLFLLAIVLMLLTLIFIPATIIWNMIAFWRKGWAKINSSYLALIAIAIDQSGNVYLSVVMNRWLIKRGSKWKYYYGDLDDTISYVTGMNFYRGNLNKFGNWVGRTLDKAEPGHMRKAIESKIKRDIEALERLKTSGLVPSDVKSPILYSDYYMKYVDKEVVNKEVK